MQSNRSSTREPSAATSPKMPKPTISTHTVNTSFGASDIRVFEPSSDHIIHGTVVTVHPWSFLGGGQHNTIGIARGISTKGWRVITFTLKSMPLYLGGAIGGILFRHYHEVNHITEVVEWAFKQYHKNNDVISDKHMVLLGSSAGAPFAGSAMAKIQQQQQAKISAFIAVGYTFGNLASLGFGRHFHSVVGNSASNFCGSSSSSAKEDDEVPPKLFIMGENDEFTSVDQLEGMVARMKSANPNCRVDVDIVKSVGHFQLESPSYDPVVAEKVVQWLEDAIL